VRRLACLSLLVYGCAASPPYQHTESPGDPRLEIAQLEGRIDTLLRERIGVARREGEPAAEEPKPAEARPLLEAAPPPIATQVAPAAPPPAKSYRVPRRPRRCVLMSEAADEICDASERICRLADQIGDGASARSCGRAREDCRRSTDIASNCH
jgi:hypothetical protein